MDIFKPEIERNNALIHPAGSPSYHLPPAGSASPTPVEAGEQGGASRVCDETVPITLRLQSSVVEGDTTVLYSRKKLEEILENRRFLISDEQGPGFSGEEKEEILSGSQKAFNNKLNVAVQADEIISMYENLLGGPLQWPSAYFAHYVRETDYAREKIASEVPDQALREKYESFIRDLSRSNESYRHDNTRVFITIGGGEERMPTFNVGRLEVNLTPYPSRKTAITTIYPAAESDSLAHELGHLCHASLRPGWDESKYNSPGDFETCALREAFADLTALFHSLGSSDERQKVLEETGGDVTKSSRATRISEEGGGDMLYRYFDEKGTPPAKRFLRELANDFVYTRIEEAPPCNPGEPSVEALSRDIYSYSQVFSGAVYDIITALHKKLLEQGMESNRALGEASATAAELLARSIEISPWWKPDFKAMAQCMLHTDRTEHNGGCRDILEDVFCTRNILSADDIRTMEETQSRLPAMTLKDIPSAPEDALRYLISKGLANDEKGESCSVVGVRKTGRGETVVVYSFEKPFNGDTSELPFDLSTAYYADICDLTPDVREKSGLVMKFDARGKLVYAQKESFHPFDRSQHYLTLTRE